MTTIAFNLPGDGPIYRPPSLDIYVASAIGGQNGQVDWSSPWRGPNLVPLRMSWGINGQLSTFTFGRMLGQGPTQDAPLHAEDVMDVRIGDAVSLMVAGAAGQDAPWFRGWVGQHELLVQSSDDVEAATFTAYGPEILLRAKCVSGQWHKRPATDQQEILGALTGADAVRGNTFASHLRVIFNEGGKPNASASAWRLSADSTGGEACARVFEAPGRQVTAGGHSLAAEYWTAYGALRSLAEYVDDGKVLSLEATTWDAIAASLGQTPIAEVNVEGMTLLEAFKAILLPVGFGFALQPWPRNDADGQPRHALLVFPLHRDLSQAGANLQPYMAPVGGARPGVADLAGRLSELQRLGFVRDNHNVFNAVTVLGDQRRVQICLEFHSDAASRDLHPCWDLADSSNDLAAYADDDGNVGGGGWKDGQAEAAFVAAFEPWAQGNYHVFRSFAWNEDGSLSGIIRNQQGPILPDLTSLGMEPDGHFLRRPRPLGPTFTCTGPAQTQVYPARVELGIDGDPESWVRIPCVRLWPDRAGFTIDCPQIHLWRPFHNAPPSLKDQYGPYTYLTLLHNALRGEGTALRLRLIGSVECDRAVAGEAPRRSQSSWPLQARRVVRSDERFRWHDVLDRPLGDSLPTAETDYESTRQAITLYAQRLRDVSEDGVAHGSILLRYLADPRRYEVGQAVGAIRGRGISLAVGAGGSYAPLIVGVNWNFVEGVNKTELLLDSPLLQVTS